MFLSDFGKFWKSKVKKTVFWRGNLFRGQWQHSTSEINSEYANGHAFSRVITLVIKIYPFKKKIF